MIQHFLARETGSGLRLPGGVLDAKRPSGVDGLPAGVDWQNYTYGPDGLCLVRMDAPAAVLTAYGNLADVLPFPRDLTNLVQTSQLSRLETVCDTHRIPRHWISAGLRWDELHRRLFRVFSLAQRLRGMSKLGLAAHLSGGEALTTQWRDLPQALRQGLLAAADSFGGLNGGNDGSGIGAGTTLGELLYDVGRGWQREAWETDPPIPPGTITDDFNRASLGGNWTTGQGGFDACSISASTVLKGDTANDCGCYYSGSSWDNIHTSEGVWGTLAGSGDAGGGPMTRCASDGDGYMYYVPNTGDNTYHIYRWDNGSSTSDLGTVSTAAFANGDAVKLGSSGTTHTASKNGSSLGSKTDATYASGSPGLQFYTTTSSFTSWSGTGEVVAGGGHPAMKRMGGVKYGRPSNTSTRRRVW